MPTASAGSPALRQQGQRHRHKHLDVTLASPNTPMLLWDPRDTARYRKPWSIYGELSPTLLPHRATGTLILPQFVASCAPASIFSAQPLFSGVFEAICGSSPLAPAWTAPQSYAPEEHGVRA